MSGAFEVSGKKKIPACVYHIKGRSIRLFTGCLANHQLPVGVNGKTQMCLAAGYYLKTLPESNLGVKWKLSFLLRRDFAAVRNVKIAIQLRRNCATRAEVSLLIASFAIFLCGFKKTAFISHFSLSPQLKKQKKGSWFANGAKGRRHVLLVVAEMDGCTTQVSSTISRLPGYMHLVLKSNNTQPFFFSNIFFLLFSNRWQKHSALETLMLRQTAGCYFCPGEKRCTFAIKAEGGGAERR